MSSDRGVKSTLAACFTLVFIAVLVAWNSPATRYESSIYSATPMATWICLGLAFAGGIGVIGPDTGTGDSA